MDDSLRVAVINTPKKLVKHLFDHHLGHVPLVFPHIFLEIIFHKFEYQI